MKWHREGPSWGPAGSAGAVRGPQGCRGGGLCSQETLAPHGYVQGSPPCWGAGSGQSGELRWTRPRGGGPGLPQPQPGMRDSVPLSRASRPGLLDRGFSSKPSGRRGCGFRVYQTSHLGDSGENRMVLLPAWTPEWRPPQPQMQDISAETHPECLRSMEVKGGIRKLQGNERGASWG